MPATNPPGTPAGTVPPAPYAGVHATPATPGAVTLRRIEAAVLATVTALDPVAVALGYLTPDQGSAIGVVVASIAAGLHLPTLAAAAASRRPPGDGGG